jgi:hypothetical protein
MDLENEVEKIEKEFVAASKQFTAMDVGNELKRRGFNVRQRQVSPVVREHFKDTELYAEAFYVRDLMPVADGKEAFVYHRIDQDPVDYQGFEQEPLPWKPEKTGYDVTLILTYFQSRN